MTKQEEFMRAINNNDLSTVMTYFNNEEIDIKDSFILIMFRIACQIGHTEIIRFLLKDGRIDPAHGDNHHLQLSVLYDQYDIVELLLLDDRIDPSAQNNNAIYNAGHRNDKMRKILWKDQRIKDSLLIYNTDLYNEFTKRDIQNNLNEF